MILEPTEKQIENSILEYLNLRPGCLAFKVQTSGVYDPKLRRFRPPGKGVMLGTPDIVCIYEIEGCPIFVGFEVKSKKGKQTASQKTFEDLLYSKCGGFYTIVRSLTETKSYLDHIRSRLVSRIKLAAHG